jgi:hypothetical protein
VGDGCMRWLRQARFLIYDEELRTNHSRRPVRLGFVGDLITHASRKGKFSTICQLGEEFTLSAQKYVAFDTPMICEIAGRVLNEANPDTSKVLGTQKAKPHSP